MRHVPKYSWIIQCKTEDYYAPIRYDDKRLKPVCKLVMVFIAGTMEMKILKNGQSYISTYPIASPYDDGPQFGFEQIEDLNYVPLK